MKIWKEFNSSHSSNISIVGSFRNIKDTDKAFKMIEDFTLASWEERYLSLNEFNEYWAANFHPDVPYIGILEEEMNSGIDNGPNIAKAGNTITISGFRTNNIGGIIKLMRFAGAARIVVE